MEYSEERKDKMVGAIGTMVFHALLVLVLFFIYLKTPNSDSLTEWGGGVPVMFGNVEEAGGDKEPLGRMGTDPNGSFDIDYTVSTPVDPTTVFQEKPTSQGEEPVATQDLDETVAINAAVNKEAERKRNEEIAIEKTRTENARIAEANRVAEQQRAAQQAADAERIRNLVTGGFGDGEGATGSRGEGTGEGTQGVKTGNASHGKMTGIGGWGSFDLGGRGVGRGGLVRPEYKINEYGTVVVDIVVNPQGNVLEATIGRGTNATSDVLKQEALRAAKRTSFEAVSKVGNQKGTITYSFALN